MYYDIDFTKKAFDTATIKPRERQTEYRVRGKTHLRLIVYTNKKTLVVRHCFKGRRKVKRIGSYPIMRLPTFERLAGEFCERLQAGGAAALAMNLPYAVFFKKIYLEAAKAKKKVTWKDDLSRFTYYIENSIGHIMMSDIRPYHIQSLLNEIPKHLSDRSHDLIRALISVSFSAAIKLELVDKNPCVAVPAKNNCNVVTRTTENEELEAFLRSALVETDVDGNQFSFHTLCLLLALMTGMRIENCQSITLDMIAPDGSSILLPETKAQKPQRIFLSEQAKWIITQARKVTQNDYLFYSPKSKKGHIGYPRCAFIRICKRAQIACSGSTHTVNPTFNQEPLTIHCLRKSFGSYVLNTTSDMELARELLGHSNVTVTQKHYAFHNNERLIRAVEVTSDAITASIPNFPRIEKAIL